MSAPVSDQVAELLELGRDPVLERDGDDAGADLILTGPELRLLRELRRQSAAEELAGLGATLLTTLERLGRIRANRLGELERPAAPPLEHMRDQAYARLADALDDSAESPAWAEAVNAYTQAYVTLDRHVFESQPQRLAEPVTADLPPRQPNLRSAFQSRLWTRLANMPGGLPAAQTELADLVVAEALNVLEEESGGEAAA